MYFQRWPLIYLLKGSYALDMLILSSLSAIGPIIITGHKDIYEGIGKCYLPTYLVLIQFHSLF